MGKKPINLGFFLVVVVVVCLFSMLILAWKRCWRQWEELLSEVLWCTEDPGCYLRRDTWFFDDKCDMKLDLPHLQGSSLSLKGRFKQTEVLLCFSPAVPAGSQPFPCLGRRWHGAASARYASRRLPSPAALKNLSAGNLYCQGTSPTRANSLGKLSKKKKPKKKPSLKCILVGGRLPAIKCISCIAGVWRQH